MFVYISFEVDVVGEIISILKFVERVVMVEFGVVWVNNDILDVKEFKE